MGWTQLYDAPEKKDIIADITRESESYKCIRQSVQGNEFWTIWQDKRTNQKTIVLFLLAKSDGNYGYKDMTEEMGPYYYKCPLAFLDEVPEVNKEWRTKVHAYHESNKKNKRLVSHIRRGQLVKLTNSNPSEFVVIGTDPLIGVCTKSGTRYKLVKARITEATELPQGLLSPEVAEKVDFLLNFLG